VSEANALHYISSTVLEPFGVTGIPTIRLKYGRHLDILDELEAYIDHVIEAQRAYGVDGGAVPRVVVQSVEGIAMKHGAYSALCTHRGDNEYKLTFSMPMSPNLVIGRRFLVP